jgi:molybdate transport system ATP-binding protein
MSVAFDISVEKRLGNVGLGYSFSAGPGLTAVVGPSGSGKTSLMNMVAGLLRPDSGRISVDGQTLFDGVGGVDLPPDARRCGYIFQDGRLFPHLRVDANLTYGERLTPAARRWISLAETVRFLGIGHLLDRWPATLSGGEAQRVAIGRALLAGPRFLLMDEPLSSLDRQRREEIMQVILRIRDELRLPILYVTHDEREVDQLATSRIELQEPVRIVSA